MIDHRHFWQVVCNHLSWPRRSVALSLEVGWVSGSVRKCGGSTVAAAEFFAKTDTKANCDRCAWPMCAKYSSNHAPADPQANLRGAPAACLKNASCCKGDQGLLRNLVEIALRHGWVGFVLSPEKTTYVPSIFAQQTLSLIFRVSLKANEKAPLLLFHKAINAGARRFGQNAIAALGESIFAHVVPPRMRDA